MGKKRREKSCSRLLLGGSGVAAHAHPSLNEWSDQPWPNCALVIRAVALQDAAIIMRLVIRFAWSERPQPERRKQLFSDGRNNSLRAFAFDQLKRQSTDGKDLIRTENSVFFTLAMIHINHIEQAATLLVPELLAKFFQTALEMFLPARRET